MEYPNFLYFQLLLNVQLGRTQDKSGGYLSGVLALELAQETNNSNKDAILGIEVKEDWSLVINNLLEWNNIRARR